MIPRKIRHALHLHGAKGGKTHRRRQLRRIEEFVQWCGCPPAQIGKRHVYEFLEAKTDRPTTARDYWYAIALLWRVLGRPGKPPKPSLAQGTAKK